MDIVNKITPRVPKRVLFFAAASVWGFASYRILLIGFTDVIKYANNYWINFFIGLVGFYFFFKSVFYKMYKKHTKRIVNSKIERPCFFSFFDKKGFGIMAFMIIGGISIKKANIFPPLYLGTFYITLGLSLLAAGISFLYAGIWYEKAVEKYLANESETSAE